MSFHSAAIRTVAAAGSHSITFDHSFYQTSGGAYTYDFLATADATLKGNLAACNDVPTTGNFGGFSNAGCLTLLANKTPLSLPDESTWTIGSNTYVQPGLPAAVANAAADGVTRNLWISCGYVSGGSTGLKPMHGCVAADPRPDGSNGSLLAAGDQVAPLVDSYTQMKVSFNTTQPNSFVVIWFGGHLAKTSVWNSLTDAYKAPGAAGAAGSSFHERLISDETGSTGNRDNQLQSGVVVPPGNLTIVKDDLTNSSTPFGFTANAPLAPGSFNLCDPAAGTCLSSQSFTSLPTGSYVVNENTPGGWTLTGIACTGSTSSFSYSATGATISLQPGDNVTCTFTNSRNNGSLTLVKYVVNDNGGTLQVIDFPLFVNGNQVTSSVANTLPPGSYTASETQQPGYAASVWGGDCSADGTVTLALGENKTCTITNNDIAPKLHLRKIVVNDNGGTATVADFTLTADGTGGNDLSGTSPVRLGAPVSVSADTVGAVRDQRGGLRCQRVVVCRRHSERLEHHCVGYRRLRRPARSLMTTRRPYLKLVKTVTNDNGGTAVATDFTLSAAGPTPISGGRWLPRRR